MNNTRFSTALHILTLLSTVEDDTYMSSDWIAGSIQVNPVIVRKEIAVLKKSGLVESQAGKEGGSKLALSAKKIKLSDVYNAIKNADLLGKKNQHPNPNCPIGKNINQQLSMLYDDAESKVLQFLGKKSLADFRNSF